MSGRMTAEGAAFVSGHGLVGTWSAHSNLTPLCGCGELKPCMKSTIVYPFGCLAGLSMLSLLCSHPS
eukprot:405831-Amphidinium_carterae.2